MSPEENPINMIDGGQIVLYVMYKWCKYVLME